MLETYCKIRYRSSIPNKSQVKDTSKCCCTASFRDRKTLTHDTIAVRNEQERYKRSSLKEYSSYIHPKWHPHWAYLKIKAWIPARHQCFETWKSAFSIFILFQLMIELRKSEKQTMKNSFKSHFHPNYRIEEDLEIQQRKLKLQLFFPIFSVLSLPHFSLIMRTYQKMKERASCRALINGTEQSVHCKLFACSSIITITQK